MSDVILNDVTNVSQLSVINDNFDKIESHLNDKAIDRTDVGSLADDVDMNGFRLYNLPAPTLDNEVARLIDVREAALGGGTVLLGVSSVNSRLGDVVIESGDVVAALGYNPAPVVSPVFMGVPIANTPDTADNSSQLATTAFVKAVVAGATTGVADFNGRTGNVVLTSGDVTTALTYTPANLVSPALTGTPTAPTAAAVTDNTQIATTAFVHDVVDTISTGVTSVNTRTGAVTLISGDITSALTYTPANLVSPTFTGVPAVPTAAPGTNTTQAASTAFVTNAVAASTTGVSSFNARTGAVTLTSGDVTGALTYTPANLISPTFTGVPSGPTAAPATNTTQLATTAFVTNAVTATGVSSFNTRTGAVTLTGQDVATAVGTAASAAQLDINTTSASPTSNSIYLTRLANYAGGVPGWVNSALFIDTTVNTGTTSFEWGLTSRIQNYATGAGENVGAFFQGNKYSTGPTWGAVSEMADMTNLPTSTTSGSAWGLEVDIAGNGADNYQKRAGIVVVVANAYEGRGLGPGIGKCYAYDGIRLTASNNDNSKGAFTFGINIMSAEGAGLLNQASGTRGIWHTGSYTVGIDLASATHAGAAIRLKANDYLSFDGSDTYKVKYNSGNGLLEFYGGGTRKGYINLVSGADVDLAGGGSYVDTTTNQNVGGIKNFTSAIAASGGVTANGILMTASNTIDWTSAGNISGTSGSLNGYLRIKIDGVAYKLPFYNS